MVCLKHRPLWAHSRLEDKFRSPCNLKLESIQTGRCTKASYWRRLLQLRLCIMYCIIGGALCTLPEKYWGCIIASTSHAYELLTAELCSKQAILLIRTESSIYPAAIIWQMPCRLFRVMCLNCFTAIGLPNWLSMQGCYWWVYTNVNLPTSTTLCLMFYDELCGNACMLTCCLCWNIQC